MPQPHRLILPETVRLAMLAHAQQTPDTECCGLLIGSGDATVTISAAHPVQNVATEPQHRFEIDPQEQFRLLRETRGTDRRVVGHYHSHPRGVPQPSAYDLAMAHDPEAIWCIIGLAPDAVYAFVCPSQTQGFVAVPLAPGG